MGEAVFRIRAEGGAEVAALLAQVERLNDASRRRMRQNARAGYRESGQDAIEADRGVTRAKLRELALRDDAQKRFRRAYAEAEKEATKLLEAEIGKRGDLTTREKRQVESLALAIVASRERAERRATEIAIKGERDRTRARERAAQHVLNGVGAAGGAAVGVAQEIHGQIQSAREQRAAIQESVIGSVSQVGVGDMAEVNRLTDSVVQAGIDHGLSPQVIAQAVAAAQTQFSSLGAMQNLGGANNAGARADVFQGAINTAVEGRNLGVDPGEFSRLQGMLSQSGMTARDRSGLAAWTVGAQDRGAVETGSVTREALGPIMQRMSAASSALGPGATQEQRSAAMAGAYRQAFAELQVFRGLGETVRRTGNSMVGFERALGNAGNIRRMSGNVDQIQDREQRARVRAALFDRQGNLNAGLSNPIAFAAAMMRAGMTNSTQIANLFAGTGAGNPMSLQTNFRTMLLGLTSRDATGKTGVDRVNALTDASTALSPEAMAARAALYEGSDRSKLNSEAASNLKALSDNTSSINRMSNTVAAWTARNPMLASALPAVAGVAGTILGAKAVAIGAGAGGFAANQRAITSGVDLQGNRLGWGERVLRAGAQSIPLLGAALGARDIAHAGSDPRTVERLLNMLPGAIATAVRDNPPQTSQQDQAHATTVAMTRLGATQ